MWLPCVFPSGLRGLSPLDTLLEESGVRVLETRVCCRVRGSSPWGTQAQVLVGFGVRVPGCSGTKGRRWTHPMLCDIYIYIYIEGSVLGVDGLLHEVVLHGSAVETGVRASDDCLWLVGCLWPG